MQTPVPNPSEPAKIKGVTKRQRKGGVAYEARIRLRGGKVLGLGSYSTEKAAERAYLKFKASYNPPPKKPPGFPKGTRTFGPQTEEHRQRAIAARKQSLLEKQAIPPPAAPQKPKPMSYEEQLVMVRRIVARVG